ncbi:hypothetical protein GF1_08390 [Desulfolithobacter dissulfuricans]|uniref:DUF8082 domain-containing protein n=1 Tax=Desulfolithobacter dissulfuricans TaxID=2795293 RepID=A0A915TZ52_9BACT|nr:hypothetical protein [Desulfolithobacter dissulfuricans]BCO08463.1 hypothetical protein GF1_08390 [Desulfolithobacter dissulfuricans]
MRKLLKEISVIPGVTGSCIFDKSEGPLCEELHPSLSADLSETVGTYLVRLFQMGGMIGLDTRSVYFRFDKYTVLGMPLDTGAVLLTICESQANCSLVATTAAMLVADMRDELNAPVYPPEEEVLEEVEAVAIEEDDGDDAELEPLFKEMEQALAAAIGPVAGVVMQDYIQRWKESGPAVPARISELAKMLVEEIGDEHLAREFTSHIHTIL